MSPDFDQRIREIMSGRRRGAGASIARGFLGCVEPFYAGAVRLRNWTFDSHIRSTAHLPRPVISVGNLTTGGTGKTPAVRWLAERLRSAGKSVAILSRGYRAAGSGPGDELTMLGQLLNRSGQPPVHLRANPDRVAAGQSLLREQPGIDLFIIDDGFQHRQLGRDFDLVLVSATEPFGFSHVLPRGMLREPLSGLRRADAVVITHADQVGSAEIAQIETEIRKRRADLPLFKAIHAQAALLRSDSEGSGSIESPDALAGIPFFAFCGLGSPDSFNRQLSRFGDRCVGHRWFRDHHEYDAADLSDLQERASAAGARVLVTTEKDWVKVAPLARLIDLPVWRVDVRLQFLGSDEEDLVRLIESALSRSESDQRKRLHGGG